MFNVHDLLEMRGYHQTQKLCSQSSLNVKHVENNEKMFANNMHFTQATQLIEYSILPLEEKLWGIMAVGYGTKEISSTQFYLYKNV